MGRATNAGITQGTTKTAPLFIASQEGYIGIVKLLLEKGADPNILVNGKTPLLIASQKKHIDIEKLLLENGANLNAGSNVNTEPLYNAVINGQTNLVTGFLEKGVDPNIASNGITPLYKASQKRYLDIMKLLLKYKADPDMHITLNYNSHLSDTFEINTATLSLLNRPVIDVKIWMDNDFTPLYMASRNQYGDVVRLLLKNGANINNPIKGGFTALFVSSYLGLIDMVKLLLENGADPDIATENKITPLCMVSKQGNIDIAKILLQNGANPKKTCLDLKLRQDFSPSGKKVYPCEYGCYKTFIIEELLDNTQNMITPQELADKYNHTKISSMIEESINAEHTMPVPQQLVNEHSHGYFSITERSINIELATIAAGAVIIGCCVCNILWQAYQPSFEKDL